MRYLFFLFLIFISCASSLNKIQLEKKYLESNSELTQVDAVERFGSPDDSIVNENYKILIWDSLLGNEVKLIPPPWEPLDSSFFGSRQIKILFDNTTGKMVEYKYWDYTDTIDFIEREELIKQTIPKF